jgi:hypothetical protein
MNTAYLQGKFVCLFVNSLLCLAPWRYVENVYLQYSGIERPFIFLLLSQDYETY